MSKFSVGSSGVALGVAGVAAAGAVIWYNFGTAPTAATDDPIVAALEVPAPLLETPKAEKPAEQAASILPDDPAPAFDEVRRESDGMTVIAGRAAPGAQVLVLLDGAEVVRGQADGTGKFATLMMIAPDGKGHVLTLSQLLNDKVIESDDQIILAPLDPPVVVAALEPAATPEPAKVSEAPSETSAQNEEAAPVVAEPEPESEVADTPQSDTPQLDVPQSDAPQNERNAETSGNVEETTLNTLPKVAEQQIQEGATTGSVTENAAQTTPTAEPEPQVEEIPRAEPMPEPEVVDDLHVEPEPQVAATAPDKVLAEVTAAPEPEPAEVETAPEVAVSITPETRETTQTETPAPVAEAPKTEAAPAQNSAPAPATKPQAAQSPEPKAEPEAPPQMAVLKATPEGVELLNTTPPAVMDNVELDTISYSDQGDVQLSGRAQTDTKLVRVYLDNAAVINLPVDAAGRWRGDLPDVDEGIYTLRVDEVANDGSVTSRVETPFKRESAQVLAAAAATQEGPLKKITVQKGATLWAIARDRYGDGLLYVKVLNANRGDIRDPDLIYPGQIFDLPDQ